MSKLIRKWLVAALSVIAVLAAVAVGGSAAAQQGVRCAALG